MRDEAVGLRALARAACIGTGVTASSGLFFCAYPEGDFNTGSRRHGGGLGVTGPGARARSWWLSIRQRRDRRSAQARRGDRYPALQLRAGGARIGPDEAAEILPATSFRLVGSPV